MSMYQSPMSRPDRCASGVGCRQWPSTGKCHGPPMASSFAQFRGTLQALACGCVLALTSCASTPPPTGDINAAQQAVARASDADAEHYAGEELARAQRLLAMAQAALSERREAEAGDLARRAAALADLAHARSREAATLSELEQRQAEITRLRRSLQMEDAR
ncbi:DUF4398 domain-containing protein [Luteimonas wenzhouensis]|uniref:DUF4398 domain-containing protein n=2 Tax=Luteimonas wenzhouensis TaxID=2599615 RepID=A0A5C5TSF5_9GAMM|nr:DUF4398 domain-containing protein [Luteimonas wenzhouensis]